MMQYINLIFSLGILERRLSNGLSELPNIGPAHAAEPGQV